MRLIDADDVIKAVDRHTFDTGVGLCLDEDISIIIEDILTVKPVVTDEEYDNIMDRLNVRMGVQRR